MIQLYDFFQDESNFNWMIFSAFLRKSCNEISPIKIPSRFDFLVEMKSIVFIGETGSCAQRTNPFPFKFILFDFHFDQPTCGEIALRKLLHFKQLLFKANDLIKTNHFNLLQKMQISLLYLEKIAVNCILSAGNTIFSQAAKILQER
jgi:hypothetical protein